MPTARGPRDRAAFEEYGAAGLARTRIDEPMREYLLRIVRLEYLGRPIPAAVVRARLWLATGYLPPELRAAMGLSWSATQQRRFDRFNRALGTVVRLVPPGRRAWPFTRSIADVRTRLAEGRDLFAT